MKIKMMMDILKIIQQNMFYIGFILLIPVLYCFTKILMLYFNPQQKDIIIKHYYNDVLLSETAIYADRNKPISIKHYNNIGYVGETIIPLNRNEPVITKYSESKP